MHQLVLRGFWRRWIIVFCCCIIGLFFIIIVTKKDVRTSPMKFSNFNWLDLNNVTHLKKCRNSKQGPHLITDEKGQLCKLSEVFSNGCCSVHTGNSTGQFVCTSCHVNRCCRIFEHCVSCCLQPRKRDVLEKVLLQAQNSRNPLLRLVEDTFELCLHKCRTSSTSVLRENKYRDSLYKYCYGVDPPQTVSTVHSDVR